jgi:hypothetical protein
LVWIFRTSTNEEQGVIGKWLISLIFKIITIQENRNKMKTRTQEEIRRQVDGLKKEKERLPEYSMFGDNNHAATDAAIEVLEERRLASDYEEYDESIHSFPEDDIEHVRQMALRAEDWLDGYTNDDLFD